MRMDPGMKRRGAYARLLTWNRQTPHRICSSGKIEKTTSRATALQRAEAGAVCAGTARECLGQLLLRDKRLETRKGI